MSTIPPNFKGKATPLGASDISNEAAALHCSVAIMHAFSDNESGGAAFIIHDGRPAMLYEARYFHHLTGGKYDQVNPNISSPVWNRALYGAPGAHQYDRLAAAMKLDPEAALQSCSIGRYQVMAFNFGMLGYKTVDDMWAAFCDGEPAHLAGFGAYIRATGLLPALQANPPKFTTLSVGYNGVGEHAQGYDTKLAAAYWHYVRNGDNAAPSPVAALSRAYYPQAIGSASIGAALAQGIQP
jgi:hypothetical protein